MRFLSYDLSSPILDFMFPCPCCLSNQRSGVISFSSNKNCIGSGVVVTHYDLANILFLVVMHVLYYSPCIPTRTKLYSPSGVVRLRDNRVSNISTSNSAKRVCNYSVRPFPVTSLLCIPSAPVVPVIDCAYDCPQANAFHFGGRFVHRSRAEFEYTPHHARPVCPARPIAARLTRRPVSTSPPAASSCM